MKIFRSGVALLTLALILGAGMPVRAASDELYFGSVAMDIPAAMHKRLKPLVDYLSDELQRPVSLKLSANLSNAASDVAAGRVHIAYLTPVAYLKAHDEGKVRLVAKPVTQGESSFRLMLVTQANSPIRSPKDLDGKSFAFGDKSAILQRAVVVGAGIQIEKLGSVDYLGHYDNIARGVLSGDFDAGIVKDTTAYDWREKGLRVFFSSPELPPYNLVVNRNIDDRTYQKIRTALLKLDKKNPAHASVIKSLDESYDGFVATSDAEYDVVRQLIKPFRK